MARYHGKGGVVYVSTSGTGAASAVVSLNAWTLNHTTDTVETTSFQDQNKTYVAGLPDAQGTIGGFYDDTESKLFSAAASDDGCLIYLYPSAAAPSKFAAGPAWLDVSINAGVAAAVAVSANFRANGNWSINL